MGEIVKFPKTPSLPQSNEELMEKWTATRMMYCDEVVNTFFSKFATQLNHVGFPLEDKKFFLRFVTASEMMRSVLYDAYGLSHPHFETVLTALDKTQELVGDDENPFDNGSNPEDWIEYPEEE